MNVGKLRKSNQAFVDSFRKKGFATRTELIDAAVGELRRAFKERERAAWREEAFKEYASSEPVNFFKEIDGDDFK